MCGDSDNAINWAQGTFTPTTASPSEDNGDAATTMGNAAGGLILLHHVPRKHTWKQVDEEEIRRYRLWSQGRCKEVLKRLARRYPGNARGTLCAAHTTLATSERWCCQNIGDIDEIERPHD
eukprot:gb/GECG01010303.1/.p1 GENE.gb/GECG01010303.1/~~gb/GECG01010303.1/.p1  ORF type:complete len:121 (+),score=15.04 gb/GECG01010303.1/:1-363(+)